MTQRSAMIEPPQKLLPLCSIDTCHGARSMAISSPPMILLAADIKNYSFRIILKISIHFFATLTWTAHNGWNDNTKQQSTFRKHRSFFLPVGIWSFDTKGRSREKFQMEFSLYALLVISNPISTNCGILYLRRRKWIYDSYLTWLLSPSSKNSSNCISILHFQLIIISMRNLLQCNKLTRLRRFRVSSALPDTMVVFPAIQ